MPHTAHTLLLTQDWDVSADDAGRIATTTGRYAIAQNVANQCRLFTRDAYFAQEDGIPYFVVGLGRNVSEAVLRTRLRDEAMRVAGVIRVTGITLNAADTQKRTLGGEITFTTEDGSHVAVEF